ncbi:endonuclease domain-containing protein [Streptomyces sp. WMMC940]|uniref:endonuclease domain-containing protein n=1 Tax=Streptomyces sp. WMMC940 TaxID=3015153 RepID=UPI003FCD85E9
MSCSVVARQARRYNLKASDMHAILELQHRVCALCARGPRGDEETSYWHVDHDHQCCQPWDFICGGCVRGLLCAGAICHAPLSQPRTGVKGSDAGSGDRLSHAAWRAGVVMTVWNSTGVSRPSAACRRRRW